MIIQDQLPQNQGQGAANQNRGARDNRPYQENQQRNQAAQQNQQPQDQNWLVRNVKQLSKNHKTKLFVGNAFLHVLTFSLAVAGVSKANNQATQLEQLQSVNSSQINPLNKDEFVSKETYNNTLDDLDQIHSSLDQFSNVDDSILSQIKIITDNYVQSETLLGVQSDLRAVKDTYAKNSTLTQVENAVTALQSTLLTTNTVTAINNSINQIKQNQETSMVLSDDYVTSSWQSVLTVDNKEWKTVQTTQDVTFKMERRGIVSITSAGQFKCETANPVYIAILKNRATRLPKATEKAWYVGAGYNDLATYEAFFLTQDFIVEAGETPIFNLGVILSEANILKKVYINEVSIRYKITYFS